MKAFISYPGAVSMQDVGRLAVQIGSGLHER